MDVVRGQVRNMRINTAEEDAGRYRMHNWSLPDGWEAYRHEGPLRLSSSRLAHWNGGLALVPKKGQAVLSTAGGIDSSPRAALLSDDHSRRLLLVDVITETELADDLPTPRIHRAALGDG